MCVGVKYLHPDLPTIQLGIIDCVALVRCPLQQRRSMHFNVFETFLFVW